MLALLLVALSLGLEHFLSPTAAIAATAGRFGPVHVHARSAWLVARADGRLAGGLGWLVRVEEGRARC